MMINLINDGSQTRYEDLLSATTENGAGDAVAVDTRGGRFHVEEDTEAPMTRFGGFVFFAEFLHRAGLFERLVRDCPLRYSSNNAPQPAEILGTILLGVLAGHTRYAHLSSLSGETILAQSLGIGLFRSEDAVRRALKRGTAEEWTACLRRQLVECCAPLLAERHILDLDVTIKPVYGHQEGADVSYNPHKPGRPSHAYHVAQIAPLRLVLWAQVKGGRQHAGGYGMSELWDLLDRLPQRCRPSLLRGDPGYASDAIMNGCETRGLPHLFRLRQTARVRELLARLACAVGGAWQPVAGIGEACEAAVKLGTWKQPRRLIVLRTRKAAADKKKKAAGSAQMELAGCLGEISPVYDYEVLVTSMTPDELTPDATVLLYRQRPDSENTFDEMKNQWCWSGFTTRDLRRCQTMALLTALFANWWNIFTRLASPQEHQEAITSRPRWLEGPARMVRGSGQRRIKLCSTHRDARDIFKRFGLISNVLQQCSATADQLGEHTLWPCILSFAFSFLLAGKPLQAIWEGAQLTLAAFNSS